jgi:hypothetical protein
LAFRHLLEQCDEIACLSIFHFALVFLKRFVRKQINRSCFGCDEQAVWHKTDAFDMFVFEFGVQRIHGAGLGDVAANIEQEDTVFSRARPLAIRRDV